MAAHQRRPSRKPPTVRSFALLFAASVPLLFCCWLIFAASFSTAELIAGAAVALLGGVALCVTEYADDSHFRPRFRDWAQIVWVPALLIQGTFEILFVSIRELLGGKKAVSAFRVARFDVGAPGDVQDTGRRVLAVLYSTATPNSIVLGIDMNERVLVFHQIERSGVRRMTKHLGALA